MEMKSDDGVNFYLKRDGAPIFLGRVHANDDRTVSRRHISLELHSGNQNSDEPRVSLEVAGKNPVWVRNGKSGEIRVYRKGERAELGSSDAFSISGRKHFWFGLRSADEIGGRVVDEGFEDVSDFELEGVDASQIDPVKEFGFVIMGHEFDSYGIHDIKKWNWFLEEPKKGSDYDDDDDAGKRSKGRRRKRKKSKQNGQGDDDDVWEGESEEDKGFISNSKKVPKPAYSTRSRDCGKLTKFGSKGKGKSKTQESRNVSEEEMGDGDDNEDDETLGGFIFDNEEEIEDEICGADDEEEEEEEFKDDDEDLD